MDIPKKINVLLLYVKEEELSIDIDSKNIISFRIYYEFLIHTSIRTF